MIKFAANISTMFTELEFLDRIGAAAKAGFKAVECQWPYSVSIDNLKQRLQDAEVSLILLNTPAGNWDDGDRGLAAIPGRVSEFQDGVYKASKFAQALDCKMVHVLAGISDRSNSEIYTDNISWAANILKLHGMTVLIEPINNLDMVGYHLNYVRQATETLASLKADNVALQYDVYHSYRMKEDPAQILESHFGDIAHIQVSDCPGRHEPGTGEINYSCLFTQIDKLGYKGWVGCEYSPIGDTVEGLKWMDDLSW
mgnify:CR=1 FL=1